MQIKDLKQDERNYRKHNKKNLDLIKKSVSEVGLGRSVVIDNENEIVCGNGLVSTLDKNTPIKVIETDGTQLVVVKRTDLNTDDEKRKQLAFMDNSTSDSSEFDLESLQADFDVEQLQDWGLDVEFESLEEQEIIEDEVPEEVETKCKLGDIWQLGNNRLMCGNSTSVTDVEKLMNGEKADMVFTDPPYLLETKGGCKGEIGKALKKQGNDIEFISNFNPDNFLHVLPNVFEKNKINAYVFCNKDLLPKYLNWAVDNKYSYNVLVWKKPNAIPIGDSHRPDIEYLLLFRKNAIWNNGLKDVNYSRCLEFSRETGLHPTMKPLKLITNEMQISSNKGSNILDPFGGSGSTLIACEQLDRKCYMMELDPKYCDVILQRYIKFKNSDEDVFLLKDGNKIPYSEVHF